MNRTLEGQVLADLSQKMVLLTGARNQADVHGVGFWVKFNFHGLLTVIARPKAVAIHDPGWVTGEWIAALRSQ